MPQVEQPEERTKMKFTLAAILVLSLSASPAFAQEQGGSSAIPLTTTVGPQPSTATVAQQTQSSALFPPASATIRVFGSPTVQPARGLGIECTPVEQSIAGVMIGPTDLCDR
jgi:hypothetical protein